MLSLPFTHQMFPLNNCFQESSAPVERESSRVQKGETHKKVTLWNKGSCWRDCSQFWPSTPQSSTARDQSQGCYNPVQFPGMWCEWLASEHCTDLHHPPSPAAPELMGCDLPLYYPRNLLLLAHSLLAEVAKMGFFSIFLFFALKTSLGFCAGLGN